MISATFLTPAERLMNIIDLTTTPEALCLVSYAVQGLPCIAKQMMRTCVENVTNGFMMLTS